MDQTRKLLVQIFSELNKIINDENIRKLKKNEGPSLMKASITLLGQMSLLANEKVSAVLTLAQTGDLDAKISMDQFTKNKLKELLQKARLVYDEDSALIWVPKDAIFEELLSLQNVVVKVIDPESALVSKAVKAKEKNKQLIRQAIASSLFPNLAKRIVEFGGDLKFFAED